MLDKTQNMEEIDMDQNKVRRNMENPAEHRERNLESYPEEKGARAQARGYG